MAVCPCPRTIYMYMTIIFKHLLLWNHLANQSQMSRVVRKPAFCICENKDADQLRGNREADQRLCFRYTDSTIPLLPKSGISSLQLSSVTVQPGLCRTWSETPKTGFLRTRLKFYLEPLGEVRTKHYKNGLCHIAKMAAMPIYGKNL